MAGAIFTTSDTLLATSTRVLDYLAERLRPHLPPEIVASAYATMDEQGMNFISFESLSAVEFQHVLRIATRVSQSESVAIAGSPYLPWWDRLLELLRSDARASASGG